MTLTRMDASVVGTWLDSDDTFLFNWTYNMYDKAFASEMSTIHIQLPIFLQTSRTLYVQAAITSSLGLRPPNIPSLSISSRLASLIITCASGRA